jgi:hypothetical protein
MTARVLREFSCFGIKLSIHLALLSEFLWLITRVIDLLALQNGKLSSYISLSFFDIRGEINVRCCVYMLWIPAAYNGFSNRVCYIREKYMACFNFKTKY